MRLLINTLSIGSMSGEHVVYGFLRELLLQTNHDSAIIILHCTSQPPPPDIIDNGARSMAIPNYLKRWFIRPLWELSRLPGLLRSHRIDRIFNVSGGITPWLKVPQVSLAMNPWCYVPAARSGCRDGFKAFMQRSSYGYAFRNAAHMIYISRHLRDLYRRDNRNHTAHEAPSTIAYVGLDQALFDAAARMRGVARAPYSILSVSAFAPWKGVETAIAAVHLLRQRNLPATLSLVGPWPDAAYEARILNLIQHLGLQDAVSIHGKVGVNELHQHYATNQLFCLMSSCESFGIPAAEAMAFGTPVVSTDCCAIAEVCEGAGQFGPLDDPHWTAATLETLLTDQVCWAELSNNARRKAARLTWRHCAQPLAEVLQLTGAVGTRA